MWDEINNHAAGRLDCQAMNSSRESIFITNIGRTFQRDSLNSALEYRQELVSGKRGWWNNLGIGWWLGSVSHIPNKVSTYFNHDLWTVFSDSAEAFLGMELEQDVLLPKSKLWNESFK